jgi:hypothetical protein
MIQAKIFQGIHPRMAVENEKGHSHPKSPPCSQLSSSTVARPPLRYGMIIKRFKCYERK